MVKGQFEAKMRPFKLENFDEKFTLATEKMGIHFSLVIFVDN
jgi:hypothetical protein